MLTEPNGYITVQVVEAFHLEAKVLHKAEDTSMSLQDFLAVYNRVERGLHRYLRDCRIAASHGPQKVPKEWSTSQAMPKVFAKYCNFGRHRNLLKDSEYEQMTMSNTQWLKLMEEMALIEPTGPMSRTSADMIYLARACSGRKLPYAHFLQALLGITAETGWSHRQIHRQVGVAISRPRRDQPR